MKNQLIPAQRSENMRRIKSKNTKPELLVRKLLHAKGYRYTLHSTKLPGHPDIALPKYKTIVDIRGCFWHGHRCSRGNVPKSNLEYWDRKIAGNKNRDAAINKDLLERGWNIIIVWECEVNSISKLHKKMSLIEMELARNLNLLSVSQGVKIG